MPIISNWSNLLFFITHQVVSKTFNFTTTDFVTAPWNPWSKMAANPLPQLPIAVNVLQSQTYQQPNFSPISTWEVNKMRKTWTFCKSLTLVMFSMPLSPFRVTMRWTPMSTSNTGGSQWKIMERRISGAILKRPLTSSVRLSNWYMNVLNQVKFCSNKP